jgi:hypothetical protein
MRRAEAAGADNGDGSARNHVTNDRRDRTSDGFTLYTSTRGTWAELIDMRGNIVHRWEMPFLSAWPNPAHVHHFPDADVLRFWPVHWFACHLYPNGDLLAVYQCHGDTPYGYGLVKLDRDSKLLWAYAGNVHHSVDVGEDGTIYTLTHHYIDEPPAPFGRAPRPCLADYLVLLSPEGKERRKVPLLEAFRDSPYAAMTGLIGKPDPVRRHKAEARGTEKGDVLHVNSVQVLTRALAPKFPQWRPGQVLLSVRGLDALAVVDPETRSVVWAARGPWKGQHDAQFLGTGRLLLFDNKGDDTGRPSAVEFSPATGAVMWSHRNDCAGAAPERGTTQRLPNGNTLLGDPDSGRIFEVTRDHEIVWECTTRPAEDQQETHPYLRILTSARRFTAEQLPFLQGRARPRP